MDRVAAQPKLSLLPLLAISLLFLPFIQATTRFNYCGDKANYAVKVEKVDISPNPVVSGEPANFTISASSGLAVSGGKAVIDVSLFGIHIHQETHELCEETSCPIPVGKFVLSHNQLLPGFTPPGTYTLKMTLSSEDGLELTCISFKFKISLFASGSLVSDT